MQTIGKIEFYITNVCNFGCENCNRFNNYRFSGHYEWDDSAELYEQWSQRVQFKEITILGGEPLLHPRFEQWVVNIRRLWPDAYLLVETNGSMIGRFDNLYEICKDNRVVLSINHHDVTRSRKTNLITWMNDYLIDPVKVEYSGNLDHWPEVYHNVKDPSWPACESADDFYLLPQDIQKECSEFHKIDPEQYLLNTGPSIYTDANGVQVRQTFSEDFVDAPIKYLGNNQFSVYNSDPELAHDVCYSKHCRHMVDGKIYKCNNVVVLPEFIKQYDVKLSEHQKQLLFSYKPLTLDASDAEIKQFFKDAKHSIPQCALCPEKPQWHKIQGNIPKPKVKKLDQIKVVQL